MPKKKSSQLKKSTTKVHFNLFDYIFFAVGIITSIATIIFYQSRSPLYIVFSVIALDSAIISTILSIKGRRSSFCFSLINALSFGFVSWSNQFYGSAMINVLFFAPCAFIGFYLWSKNSRKNGEVIARKLTFKQVILVIATFLISTFSLNFFLESVGGQSTILDSSGNILVIFASILVVFRYREQWLFWFASDILQLIMWSTASDPTILVMRIFFVFGSIYGYINWRKLLKKP